LLTLRTINKETTVNTRNINTQQGTVAAFFRDHDDAENAVKDLRDAGFRPDQIGIAGPQKGRGFFDKVADFFSGGADETYYSDFAGSLSRLDVPDAQATQFEQALSQGYTLVTVRPLPSRQADVWGIFKQHGGEGDISQVATRRDAGVAPSGEQRIRLLGETLRIHKERVARGEVRLRKEVVTEQQNVQVPVSREELVVERMPGRGSEARPGETIGSEKEIRVPLSEERVRVEKKPVVNEEIAIGKRQVQATKQVSDTLRREEVHVEPEGDISETEVKDSKKKRIA
jgi:uncharacterized protein (TIGR02271 family)